MSHINAIAGDLFHPDLVIRRAILRCSLVDVRNGSQFAVLPVWVMGFLVAFFSAMYLIAKRT